jgi:hypothetical protein
MFTGRSKSLPSRTTSDFAQCLFADGFFDKNNISGQIRRGTARGHKRATAFGKTLLSPFNQIPTAEPIIKPEIGQDRVKMVKPL